MKYLVTLLLFCQTCLAMDNYNGLDKIPLSYSRIRNNALVTGLTVTVVVTNALTNAVLLASTSVPEISSSGMYSYNWVPHIFVQTECMVTYTVGTNKYVEFFIITDTSSGQAR